MIDSKAMRMKGTNCWWARQDLNLGPTVGFKYTMLLILLASDYV
jgi:hypothetical protein